MMHVDLSEMSVEDGEQSADHYLVTEKINMLVK